MHRIHSAMTDDGKLLSGLVEIDEAYLGGKPRKHNRRDDDTPSPRGRATRKTPIVGAVERDGRDEMTGDDMEAFVRETTETRTSLIGQWHHVSRKYLPLYLRELAYRYNLRQVGFRTQKPGAVSPAGRKSSRCRND